MLKSIESYTWKGWIGYVNYILIMLLQKKRKKATGVHGQWSFQNITKIFDAHWFLSSSIFLQSLKMALEKAAIKFVHAALQDGNKLAYSFFISCLHGEILDVGDSWQLKANSQLVTTYLDSGFQDWNASGPLVFVLSVGLYLYWPHLSVTNGNYVEMMKPFGMKIQNLVKT